MTVRQLAVAVGLAVVGWFLVCVPALAATIQVTTSVDENGTNPSACSLREAVSAVTAGSNGTGGCVASGAYGSGDQITFAAATNGSAIALNHGEILISTSMQIVGNGAGSTILDGQKGTAFASRVLHVSGGTVGIDGMTIRNGVATGSGLSTLGGGIFTQNAAVTVSNSAFSNNSAIGSSGFGGAITSAFGSLTVTTTTFSANSAGGIGGGIFVDDVTTVISNSTFTSNSAAGGGGALGNEGGAVTVSNSTFSNNSASGFGGAFFAGFGVVMTVTNSTFSNNSAGTSGGGIYFLNGTLTVSNSTLSGNSAPNGGGLYNDTTLGGSTVNVRGAILDTGASGSNCFGGITSLGSNLSDDASCGFAQTGDQNSVGGLNLGPLLDNGGPTLTHALGSGSAAIDAIQGLCTTDGTAGGTVISFDQRGAARPSGARCDAGAFEVATTTPGSLQFSAPTFTVGEAGPSASVTVTRTGGTDFQVSATVSLANGAAIAPGDYDSAIRTVTFAPGDAANKSVSIPIVDDALDEADETVGLILSSPSGGATLAAQTTATLTIADNDPTPTLSIDDVTVAEGNIGNIAFVFSVILNAASGQQVTVQAQTSDGSATVANNDYTAVGLTTLTFAPGDTTKTLTVQVTSDTTNEAAETFVVNLTNATNATILDSQGIGTISNDDGVPGLSIANVTVAEGNSGASTALFTVSRTGATASTATVQYTTADGSARSGADYTATSGTLTFAPNESSKTIAVTILGDTLSEPDETFTVTLSNPTNATIGVAQAVGAILNDDVVVACTPRPRVTQTLTADGSVLAVHVESTPMNTPANNPLQQIRFGALQNATVTMNGKAVNGGQSVAMPASTFAADFVVRRVTLGQPTTVRFTVLDGCGEWNTFVGGGAAAGF